jgi:uncharacterized membrane protein
MITALGSENFFLLIAPAIYWCIHPAIGLRMGIYLSLSAAFNSLLKLIFHDPRPYWVDRDLNPLAAESSFGMPSGHAQNSVVVWGSLAASVKKTWVWVIAIIMMLAIGLSRLYLMVHSLDDVIVGWIVGAFLLWGLLKLEPRVLAWLKRHRLSQQVGAAFGISVGLILLLLLITYAFPGWELPQEWLDNTAAAFPDLEPINPTSSTGVVSNAAVFFGLAAGAMWLFHNGGYRAGGSIWQLLLRYLIGLAGVLIIWGGLDRMFPAGEGFVELSLRYIRYALVGIWISGLAPYLFIKLKLAQTERI